MWSVWGKSVALVGAVGLCVALPVAQPALAYPGDNGRIAYTDSADVGGVPTKEQQVWTMRSDGTDKSLHFSAIDEDNFDAAWSPDGQWLAFTRQRNLVVARPDGTDTHIVAGRGASQPTWSPDGTRLVYAGHPGLWMVDADGSDPHQLVAGEHAAQPAWQPNGGLIAYQDFDGDMEIFVTNAYGNFRSQLTSNWDPLDEHASPVSDTYPVWSPDGSQILFVSNRDAPLDCLYCASDLYLMTASGTSQTRLHYAGIESAPTWSPDGSRVAFASESTVPDNSLPWFSVRNMDIGEVTRVARTSTTPHFDWGVAPGSMRRADLSSTIDSVKDMTTPDGKLRYTVTVVNDGPAAARTSTAEVALPAGSVFVSSDSACSGQQVVRCALGSLSPASSVTLTIVTDAPLPGAYEVAAMATSNTADPDFNNNRSTTPVATCTQLSGPADATLIGTPGNDVLCGGGGSDELVGAGGDDVLIGGTGSDTLRGGDGQDSASYPFAKGAVSVDIRQHSAHGGDGADVLANLEDAEGSHFADVLLGSASSNRLLGGDGTDVISGRSGYDTLIGGSGRDVMAPGTQDDRVNGDLGTDTIDFSSARSRVNLSLDRGYALGQGHDALTGIENALGSRFADVLEGSVISNRLFGDRGQDRLVGMGSNDLAQGGEGPDRLSGGDGNDRLAGGAGRDTCKQNTGTGSKTTCER